MVGLEQIQESGSVEAAGLILMKKTYLGLDTIKVAKQCNGEFQQGFSQDFLEIYPRFTEGLP